MLGGHSFKSTPNDLLYSQGNSFHNSFIGMWLLFLVDTKTHYGSTQKNTSLLSFKWDIYITALMPKAPVITEQSEQNYCASKREYCFIVITGELHIYL